MSDDRNGNPDRCSWPVLDCALSVEIDRLRAENARLREALGDAIAHMEAACAVLNDRTENPLWVTEFSRATNRARAALRAIAEGDAT